MLGVRFPATFFFFLKKAEMLNNIQVAQDGSVTSPLLYVLAHSPPLSIPGPKFLNSPEGSGAPVQSQLPTGWRVELVLGSFANERWPIASDPCSPGSFWALPFIALGLTLAHAGGPKPQASLAPGRTWVVLGSPLWGREGRLQNHSKQGKAKPFILGH